MKIKLALGLLIATAALLPANAAKAQTYQACTDDAWDAFFDCSVEAGADAAGHVLKDTAIGGAVGAAAGGLFGPPGAAAGGRSGATGGLIESVGSELWDQGECAVGFATDYVSCQDKPRNKPRNNNQSGSSFGSSDPNYSRDTTGDGMADQSYSDSYSDDYGYSDFSDEMPDYSSW